LVKKREQKLKPTKGRAATSTRRKVHARVPGTTKRLSARGHAILSAATVAGYLRGEKTERIGGRVTRALLFAAMAKSGLTSHTELLEYALSKVALEDDYGEKLLAMKGCIPPDVDF
jgi:hypothetical protein